MGMEHTLPTETADLALQVEGLVDAPEPDGVHHDSAECAALLVIAGAGGLLLSTPTPRPKKSG
ncbi:hypothetical protein ACIPSE_32465 [Streptomyces sp. NPDC090106]|uniref:hypothetical protein n=1 Tax=Streptomyces sp. NPDC090106 TaxID=3365946 RepID=UPI00381E24FD